MDRAIETLLQTAKGLQARWYRSTWVKWSRRLSIHGEQLIRTHRDPIRTRLNGAKTIVLFKPDDIGDAVHSLPALHRLRKRWPGKDIHLVCQKATVPLYERSGLVNHIHPLSVRKVALRFPIVNLSKLRIPHANVAVFFRTYPAFLSQFKRLSADLKIVPWEPRLLVPGSRGAPVHLFPGNKKHQAEILLEMVGFLTGDFWEGGEWEYPPLHWQAGDKALTPSQPFVAIHPFARFETRQYPLELWTEWVRWLVEVLDLPVYVLGGPDDPPYDADGLAIPMQGKLSLAQTGHWMSQATLFVGSESGPAHWAGAMGTPTLVFFGGHSDPIEWAPVGPRVFRLHEPVPCGPCHRRFCPGYGVRCLKQLTLENWKDDVLKFLKQNIQGASTVRGTAPVETQGSDRSRLPPDLPPPADGT